MLTGYLLFSGRTIEEIQAARRSKPLPIEQLKAAHVPRRFISLLTSMLAIEPAARPAGARELSARLQAIRASIIGRGKTAGRVALAAAIVALATIVAVRVFHSSGMKATPSLIPEKSIAVLPFENLSRDSDSAYFADGIQEEILTRLAKIADLKVISRTSTQRYQSKPRNLGEIAKQLGVANILEGSVQKIADQVRVNVQLINAQTDSHLWAETYDRKLTDIFGVESEIAKGIAELLQAKLTGREEQALAVKPTNNPEAYDAYLRGLAFQARNDSPSPSVNLLTRASDFYQRAVQLDPNFAIAWARLSRVDAQIYWSLTTSAARRDAAKRALENARKLEPNSPETLLALGYYQFWALRDYGAAKTTFSRVSKMLPGSSDVPWGLARIAEHEGQWDQCIDYIEQALTLDPRNVGLLMDAASDYGEVRQFPTALKLYDRALDIMPNDQGVMAGKVSIYQAQGNLQEAARLVSEIIGPTYNEDTLRVKLTHLRLERNYGEAVRLLQAQLTQFQAESEYDKGWEQVALALMQRFAGDTAGATVTAEQARNTLEQLHRDQPDNSVFAAWLSQAYAVIGERDSALKLAAYAIMLNPRAKDHVNGPWLEENQAFIQTMFGENSRAISTLTGLLQTPYGSMISSIAPITAALLRLDPIWDPLRSDPSFQDLCKDKLEKSIAVLPFENLSRDPDNAYFAEGIQEEILTRLAKIADLKVISRASTSRYKSKPDNLSEIARQLGVANILEGSVQKAADQVRVNVQLINAQTDSHLWADTYDRKLTDFLGVESEIAKGIAESLQAKLTGREEQALAVKPTNNAEAYDAYLRGLAFQTRNRFSIDTQRKAAGFYERAVQLDPNFALAWARLSRADGLIYLNHADNSYAARAGAAKRALENAQRLEPNSAQTQLALGYYQCQVLVDYESAKITFEQVRKMLPSNSEVLFALGSVTKREGQWDDSVAYLQQALALDPGNVNYLTDVAGTYAMLRQLPAALEFYDRTLEVTPYDPDVMAKKAAIYQAQGNLQEAASLLSEINPLTLTEQGFAIKLSQLKLERNYTEAVRLLQARQAQFHFGSQFAKLHEQVALALTQRLAGDTAGGAATADQARQTFEELYNNQPDNFVFAANLSQAYAAMGDKESALKAAERAVMLLPTDKDRVNGPTLEHNLALIQTIFGETSRPISTLRQLLQTPYNAAGWLHGPLPVTPALLRLDPFWDPLRGDPAFQKLCEEKQP